MARCLHFLNCRLESLRANCSDTVNIFDVRGFAISTGQKRYLTALVSHFFIHVFFVPLEVRGFSYILEDGSLRDEVPRRGGLDLIQARRSG